MPSDHAATGVARSEHTGFWGRVFFYGVIGLFALNLLGMVGSVVVDPFATQWFGTWLPPGFTATAYQTIADDHDLQQLLITTVLVALLTTILALIGGLPAAYMLARHAFRFKPLLLALYTIPMLVPPLVYGIPLATLLLQLGLGGTLAGIVLINLVPVLPFVILIMVPFLEQIDPSLEAASRMLGASRLQTLYRILLPLLMPGLLTAGVLAVVRTVAMFELTFLIADATTQTMVVALYADAISPGIRANQTIDAMAVVYMLTTMSLLVLALLFVRPTQFVVRIKTR